MSRTIKRFKEFYLSESRNPSNGIFPIFEDAKKGDKPDSYRPIAYGLAEIFALYGFFFAQKENFFDVKNWPKLMDQIIKIKDPKARWETIVKMSKFLQSKVKTIKPSPNEFGYRGSYDYGNETEDLPKATEFLRAASNAAFKNFTPEEQQKSLDIMDDILKNMQPLKISRTSQTNEAVKYLPPTESDLLRMADSSGNKLLNMYNTLNNLKTSYPESVQEIDSFINSQIMPNVQKVQNFIDVEIPKISGPAAEGFFKKLQSFDKSIDAILPKAEELRKKIVSTYQPVAASKEFLASAMGIITEVRQGIMNQAEMNARRVKAGDVIAGTTDISDPKYSGDLQTRTDARKAEKTRELKKRGFDDLADFLAKKYSIR